MFLELLVSLPFISGHASKVSLHLGFPCLVDVVLYVVLFAILGPSPLVLDRK
jgi:hypothetical protein